MDSAVVVVGAGVSGLTSALLLSRDKSKAVTIVAKHMPGDYDIEYASPWAGASFFPLASPENHVLEERTWPELKKLAQGMPEAGVHFQSNRIVKSKQDSNADASQSIGSLYSRDDWCKSLMPDYRELNADEVPAGYDSGCEFTSVCINVAVYLPWLLGQCLKQGVVFKRAVLSHLSEAAALSHTGHSAHVVVNATGLGSLRLGGVADAAMTPARGQTLLVRNHCPFMLCTSGHDDQTEVLYFMERAAGGGTLIGGTYQLGVWTAEPDPDTAGRIAARAVEAYPALAGGRGVEGLDIIRHGVGLRPYRKHGVRLEADSLHDGTRVVHNYGHAGWGYSGSYGCAERVVELVDHILTAK
ncbi:hypothetical protein CDD81_4605 [Ophiocordyceps australis]|uniref:FAD dependent oxidoreductase domain-containing protein n=1 Tax=Ophiocordyceps australis TaxID=1399860 RepID=A0A2C5YBP4_9HYPO|nr:hypothetical protein CDD81_4605 [Ophiocordyceps australis]